MADDGTIGQSLASATPGARAAELFKEARQAADDNVTRFLRTLENTIEQAREIGLGGEVYPAGVRDICNRLSEHTAFRAQAIFCIMRPDPMLPFRPVQDQLEEADLELEMRRWAKLETVEESVAA